MSIKVMSFNIRVQGDKAPNSVQDRAPRFASYMEKYSPDIISLQEVSPLWLPTLETVLSEYDSEFKYRAEKSHEAVPLYWKKLMFQTLEQGTFWLSDTPETESIPEGALFYRTCSFAVLKENATSQLYIMLGTHFDIGEDVVRTDAAKLIAARGKALKAKYTSLGYKNIVLMCMGDLNCSVGSEAYNILASEFSDCRYIAKNMLSAADTKTFNNYGNGDSDIIDHVFCDNGTTDVLSYHVTDEDEYDGYVSDHYGIVCEITPRI